MQASSQLYIDAIDILADQDEGKQALSGDIFRQAIGMHNLPYPLLVFPHGHSSRGLKPHLQEDTQARSLRGAH